MLTGFDTLECYAVLSDEVYTCARMRAADWGKGKKLALREELSLLNGYAGDSRDPVNTFVPSCDTR